MNTIDKITMALVVCGAGICVPGHASVTSDRKCAEIPAQSKTWNPDKGDGTYVNPVIFADYSDPDVVRVGDTFYMTASSFQAAPGLPILTSKDLVNWTISNYALEKVPPASVYAVPQHGKGVWAPSIRYHDGKFYIFWGDPDYGIFMVRTDDPLGKWEEPVLVKAGKGMIDPCPLWDDDGKAYLVNGWAASRSGMNSVLTVWEMAPDGTSLTGAPVLAYDGNIEGNHTAEGPKFYKKDGKYYILCPAGGVAQGWQVAMRSDSPFGPYESRIVMRQGSTDINGPHQGGLVDAPDGKSWFVHFQETQPYGRVIHLNPVEWKEGWPEMGRNGEPVRRHRKPVDTAERCNPQESDEFDDTALGLQWQWHANYSPLFGMTSPNGYMRIYGYPLSENYRNFWEVPNLLLQKFPAPEFTATCRMKVSASHDGQQSGLIVMGRDYARVAAERKGDDFILKYAVCHEAESGAAEETEEIARVPATRLYDAGSRRNRELDIWLRVKVGKGGVCRFSYSLDGKKFKPAGKDFQAREGKWIGAKVGAFSVQPGSASRGWTDLDWFHIEK